ncbi:hypothetical protein PIB30_088205, partial [Stylosanthes scabra]|nr:hypothetical protein [Stylosanthes scabra]
MEEDWRQRAERNGSSFRWYLWWHPLLEEAAAQETGMAEGLFPPPSRPSVLCLASLSPGSVAVNDPLPASS